MPKQTQNNNIDAINNIAVMLAFLMQVMQAATAPIDSTTTSTTTSASTLTTTSTKRHDGPEINAITMSTPILMAMALIMMPFVIFKLYQRCSAPVIKNIVPEPEDITQAERETRQRLIKTATHTYDHTNYTASAPTTLQQSQPSDDPMDTNIDIAYLDEAAAMEVTTETVEVATETERTSLLQSTYSPRLFGTFDIDDQAAHTEKSNNPTPH